MLACELALAGIRPLVLERLPEPTEENRANGLVGQVVRLLDRRGLHDRLAGPIGPPAPGFVFGAVRRGAAAPLGDVHLGHSDCSGLPLVEEAVHHGIRAAEEILARRGLRVESLL